MRNYLIAATLIISILIFIPSDCTADDFFGVKLKDKLKPETALFNVRRIGKTKQPEYEIVDSLADDSIVVSASTGFQTIDFKITNNRHDAIKIDANKDVAYLVCKDGTRYKCDERTKLFPLVRVINPVRTVYMGFSKPKQVDRHKVGYIILNFGADDISLVLKPIEYFPTKELYHKKIRGRGQFLDR